MKERYIVFATVGKKGHAKLSPAGKQHAEKVGMLIKQNLELKGKTGILYYDFQDHAKQMAQIVSRGTRAELLGKNHRILSMEGNFDPKEAVNTVDMYWPQYDNLIVLSTLSLCYRAAKIFARRFGLNEADIVPPLDDQIIILNYQPVTTEVPA